MLCKRLKFFSISEPSTTLQKKNSLNSFLIRLHSSSVKCCDMRWRELKYIHTYTIQDTPSVRGSVCGLAGLNYKQAVTFHFAALLTKNNISGLFTYIHKYLTDGPAIHHTHISVLSQSHLANVIFNAKRATSQQCFCQTLSQYNP